jgi:hypothetical protein
MSTKGSSRTELLCICEGTNAKGSVDHVFVRQLLKKLSPSWVRTTEGRKAPRVIPAGGRNEVINQLYHEMTLMTGRGASFTLMVWADLDHDQPDPDRFASQIREGAKGHGIPEDAFDNVVFVFAKDRLENWIEYLLTGKTDEGIEGPRVEPVVAAEAARKLADLCERGAPVDALPPSLKWSCDNWHALKRRLGR